MELKTKMKLWEEIHKYVRSCGGNPDENFQKDARMNAVVRVEAVVCAEYNRGLITGLVSR